MSDAVTVAERLRAEATTLSFIASRLGLSDLAARIETSVRTRLEDGILRVAVVGEIKHGKSSLINALVGEPVLPVGVTPTTAAPVVVCTGGPAGPGVRGRDGVREPVDPVRFAELVRGRAETAGRLEVGARDLDGLVGVEILDTPGINDLDRVKTSVSRGELPTADVLVMVLDATQLLNRTELGFLREAVAAVGGLGRSGAKLLVVVNRIDLAHPDQHGLLREHLRKFLPVEVDPEGSLFLTDARGALTEPGATTPGVRGVAALRSRLRSLAAERPSVMPARARAMLLRDAHLLGHHAAISARALTLDQEAVTAELEQVRKALVGQRQDLEELRQLLGAGRDRILTAARTRTEEFREELELSSLGIAQVANLKVLSSHLPASIHDACVAFVRRETDSLRASLDELTRKVLHTHGERARERLAHATLRLGFHGPTVFIDPPSLTLEASAVAIGVAGTAIMYFGNLVTGMVMTVAGPLATVMIREQSVRHARDRARAILPDAVTRAAAVINEGVERVVSEHVAAVQEHLELAEAAIGEQLVAVLARAREQLAGDEGARAAARTALEAARGELAALTRRLTALEIA